MKFHNDFLNIQKQFQAYKQKLMIREIRGLIRSKKQYKVLKGNQISI